MVWFRKAKFFTNTYKYVIDPIAAFYQIPMFILTMLSFTENLRNGRFHEHLRDTFAPLVVRYVDLMESSIAQSLHKGFEKERWEIKGYLHY